MRGKLDEISSSRNSNFLSRAPKLEAGDLEYALAEYPLFELACEPLLILIVDFRPSIGVDSDGRFPDTTEPGAVGLLESLVFLEVSILGNWNWFAEFDGRSSGGGGVFFAPPPAPPLTFGGSSSTSEYSDSAYANPTVESE